MLHTATLLLWDFSSSMATRYVVPIIGTVTLFNDAVYIYFERSSIAKAFTSLHSFFERYKKNIKKHNYTINTIVHRISNRYPMKVN
jgi:hypothetical protein